MGTGVVNGGFQRSPRPWVGELAAAPGSDLSVGLDPPFLFFIQLPQTLGSHPGLPSLDSSAQRDRGWSSRPGLRAEGHVRGVP